MPRPTAFFDMDGLLADFYGGACLVHGKEVPLPAPYDPWNVWGMDPSAFWEPLANREFWAALRPLADGMDLLRRFRAVADDLGIKLAVCSSGLCPGSVDGKLDWLRRHAPDLAGAAVFTPHKELCAGPGKLLIDDHGPNVDWFTGHGGAAVLVPRSWNALSGKTTPGPAGGSFDPVDLFAQCMGHLFPYIYETRRVRAAVPPADGGDGPGADEEVGRVRDG